MSLKEFREAKGFEDYYKSAFDLKREEGEIERFVDGLEDAIGLFEMEREIKRISIHFTFLV